MDLRRLGVLAHWDDDAGAKRVLERRLLKLRDSLPAIARYRVPPLRYFSNRPCCGTPGLVFRDRRMTISALLWVQMDEQIELFIC